MCINEIDKPPCTKCRSLGSNLNRQLAVNRREIVCSTYFFFMPHCININCFCFISKRWNFLTCTHKKLIFDYYCWIFIWSTRNHTNPNHLQSQVECDNFAYNDSDCVWLCVVNTIKIEEEIDTSQYSGTRYSCSWFFFLFFLFLVLFCLNN